jgi:transmembrane sensor
VNAKYQENLRMAEAAADWLMRLESEGCQCHAGFSEWLMESPQHVREFLAVTSLSRRLGEVDPLRTMDVEALIAKCSANVTRVAPRIEALRDDCVMPAAGEQSPASGQRRAQRKWRVAGSAAAVALLALAMMLPGRSGTKVYATAMGEQRTFKLPDGSLIYLNTLSRAEVRFSAGTRNVRLLKGEALFVVEQDATRPFRVLTDDAIVQAVGTQFNVRRLENGIVVSVVEGRVRLTTASAEPEGSARSPAAAGLERSSHLSATERPADAASSAATRGTTDAAWPSMRSASSAEPMRETVGGMPLLLDAGQEARTRHDGQFVRSAMADIGASIAWRQRRLSFREDTLADVAAEFNRYNVLQIRVVGNDLMRRQLTGSFNADNPQNLIRFLEKDESLQIEQSNEVVVIRARQSGQNIARSGTN